MASLMCCLNHNWEYERYNSLIIRMCKRSNCLTVEEAIFIEEPQLCSWAKTRFNPDKLVWKRI